ncbi:MAG: hypothetical protein ACLTDX_22555 [[Clostridium] innocuum]
MLHLLKYRFRLMIRNRVLLFWTLIFPMLLTTFFGMVLKDAYTVDTFQTCSNRCRRAKGFVTA